jgi:hypothetical protein
MSLLTRVEARSNEGTKTQAESPLVEAKTRIAALED